MLALAMLLGACPEQQADAAQLYRLLEAEQAELIASLDNMIPAEVRALRGRQALYIAQQTQLAQVNRHLDKDSDYAVFWQLVEAIAEAARVPDLEDDLKNANAAADAAQAQVEQQAEQIDELTQLLDDLGTVLTLAPRANKQALEAAIAAARDLISQHSGDDNEAVEPTPDETEPVPVFDF